MNNTMTMNHKNFAGQVGVTACRVLFALSMFAAVCCAIGLMSIDPMFGSDSFRVSGVLVEGARTDVLEHAYRMLMIALPAALVTGTLFSAVERRIDKNARG